jgi:hypothetical protein
MTTSVELAAIAEETTGHHGGAGGNEIRTTTEAA